MGRPLPVASLDDAFDPTANAAYAARFLSALYTETGSWEAAAGRYHSVTPALGEAYRERVLAQWSGAGAETKQPRARPQPALAAVPPPEPPLPDVFAIAPIDNERMARITTAWRARQGAGSGAPPDLQAARMLHPAGTLVASAEPRPSIVRANAFAPAAGRDAAARNAEAEAAFAQRRAQVLHEWRQSAQGQLAHVTPATEGSTVTILRGNARSPH